MKHKLILPIIWTVIIVISSIVPIPEKEKLSTFLDVGHIAVYTILALLWSYSLGNLFRAFTISLISTPLTEIVQLFTPWRSSNLADVLNNLIGVLIGIILFKLFTKVRKS